MIGINSKNKNNIFLSCMFFLLLLINLPSRYIESIGVMNDIYNVLELFCFCFVFILAIKNKVKSKIFILISLYYISYILSTLLNGSFAILYILKNYMVAFNLIISSEIFLKTHKDMFLKTGSIFFTIYIVINLITILLFPDGIYVGQNTNPHFFLGQRNDSIEYILLGLLFVFLWGDEKNNKWFLSFFAIVCFLNVFLTRSANAIVSISFVLLYIWLPTKNILQKYITYFRTFFCTVMLFLMFVIFRLQKYFSWFITGVLHKSLSFTGRTKLWNKAILWIGKSPIYGYGVEDTAVKLAKIGHGNSCHNYFLDFMYSGGIIMLSSIMYILYILGKKLSEIPSSNIKNIMIGICGGYFIIWFATPIHLNNIVMMFMSFMMVFYVQIFIKGDQNNEVNKRNCS